MPADQGLPRLDIPITRKPVPNGASTKPPTCAPTDGVHDGPPMGQQLRMLLYITLVIVSSGLRIPWLSIDNVAVWIHIRPAS